MIQRIQTIFLFLAAITFIALFYLPFATTDVAAGTMLADKLYTVEDHILLGGLCLLGGILSLVAIFLFKNRPMQLRVGYILIIVAIFIVFVAIGLFILESQQYASTVNISEGFGIGMPILTIILIVFANRFIRKDEKTVRSMDRLR